jgi:hypothetical protein
METNKYSHSSILRALEGLSKGLIEFCDYNPQSYKAQIILVKITERLSQERAKKVNETAPDFLKISELL